jgi:N-acetylmuramoyl-L-alanine amidase
MNRYVMLDPGHGGNGKGCEANGIVEDAFVYKFACTLEQMIRVSSSPIIPFLSRGPRETVSIRDRNGRAGNDTSLILSIHVNAYHDHTARGAMAFVSGQSEMAIRVGQKILEAWPLSLEPSNRMPVVTATSSGYPRARAVVYSYGPPVVLLEMFFATSENDAAAVRNPAVYEQMLLACQIGLLEIFV